MYQPMLAAKEAIDSKYQEVGTKPKVMLMASEIIPSTANTAPRQKQMLPDTRDKQAARRSNSPILLDPTYITPY